MEKIRGREICRRVVVRLLNAKLLGSFQRWREGMYHLGRERETLLLAREQQLIETAALLGRASFQFFVFTTWKVHVRELREQRRIDGEREEERLKMTAIQGASIIARLQQGKLFSRWRRYTRQKIKQQEWTRRRKSREERVTCAMCFVGWSSWWRFCIVTRRERKEHEEEIEHEQKRRRCLEEEHKAKIGQVEEEREKEKREMEEMRKKERKKMKDEREQERKEASELLERERRQVSEERETYRMKAADELEQARVTLEKERQEHVRVIKRRDELRRETLVKWIARHGNNVSKRRSLFEMRLDAARRTSAKQMLSSLRGVIVRKACRHREKETKKALRRWERMTLEGRMLVQIREKEEMVTKLSDEAHVHGREKTAWLLLRSELQDSLEALRLRLGFQNVEFQDRMNRLEEHKFHEGSKVGGHGTNRYILQ